MAMHFCVLSNKLPAVRVLFPAVILLLSLALFCRKLSVKPEKYPHYCCFFVVCVKSIGDCDEL